MNTEPHRPRGQLDAADYLVIALALLGMVVVTVAGAVTVLVERQTNHPPTCPWSGYESPINGAGDRGT